MEKKADIQEYVGLAKVCRAKREEQQTSVCVNKLFGGGPVWNQWGYCHWLQFHPGNFSINFSGSWIRTWVYRLFLVSKSLQKFALAFILTWSLPWPFCSPNDTRPDAPLIHFSHIWAFFHATPSIQPPSSPHSNSSWRLHSSLMSTGIQQYVFLHPSHSQCVQSTLCLTSLDYKLFEAGAVLIAICVLYSTVLSALNRRNCGESSWSLCSW